MVVPTEAEIKGSVYPDPGLMHVDTRQSSGRKESRKTMKKRPGKFRMKMILLAAVLLLGSFCAQAGVTVAYADSHPIMKVSFAWVSDATGDASTTTTRTICGQILRACFIPGDATPSNNYDITLTDSDGLDVLITLGSNLSNSTASQVVPVVTNGTDGNMAPNTCCGVLTFTVDNAGATKSGTLVIYVRRG